MILYVWLVPQLLWLFLLGAAVGSFLNVCIYRVPLGKSLLWPGSRCGHCFQEVRLKDNIPLVSYWVLRGRCRTCGAPFSVRYFLVELLTAVAFVALYLLEIGLNVQHLPVWPSGGFAYFDLAQAPPHSWEFFVVHVVLACFLIVAAGCLLDRGRLPDSIAVTGTLAGLIAAVAFPWPYPQPLDVALVNPSAPRPTLAVDGGSLGNPWRGAMPRDDSWSGAPLSPRPGFYPWPVWGPPPPVLPAGSWQLGLVSGLAGALAGGCSVRLLALIPRKAPTGAAGLAMLAGAFLGWQPILVAVVLALAVALPLARRCRVLPLGPCLVPAIVVVWFGWSWIGPAVRPVFFNPMMLAILLAATLVVGGIGVLLGRRQLSV
jgi:leader peptidase (prepilin peptidase) / N-methyltransferase